MGCTRTPERAMIVIVIMFSLPVALARFEPRRQRQHVPAFFVFGDSLADAGNNNYIRNTTARANFPPYGQTFFHRPTGRFTDGRTAFDFIASRLGLQFPPPFLQPEASHSLGINFASGGSGLLDSTGKEINIIPLSLQIRQFTNISRHLTAKKNGSVDAAKFFLSDSLYAISSGGNDVRFYLQNATFRNATSPRDFVKLLLQQYNEYLLGLHRGGARNFIILDIPPLGCSPYSRLAGFSSAGNGGCLEVANRVIKAYNGGLRQLIRGLNRNLAGATLLYVNSYDFVLHVIQHGRAYGFAETRWACCGAGPFNTAVNCGRKIPKAKRGKYRAFLCRNPSKYVFWDGSHPTEVVNHMVSRQIWRGNSSFISPLNLKTLLHKHANNL